MQEIKCTCPFTGMKFKALMHEQTKDLYCTDVITGEKYVCWYDPNTDSYQIDSSLLIRQYDLVSQTAAAYILGVTRQRISQIAKQEIIKPLYINGKCFFNREDVLQYKKTRKVGAPKKED